MPTLLNNCRNRPHAAIYADAAAFYDVEPSGPQDRRYGRILAELRPGSLCIVASRARDGLLEFTHWEFARMETLPDNNRYPHRVLFGRRLSSELLTKPVATTTPAFAGFFNRLGHFRRASVIRA